MHIADCPHYDAQMHRVLRLDARLVFQDVAMEKGRVAVPDEMGWAAGDQFSPHTSINPNRAGDAWLSRRALG